MGGESNSESDADGDGYLIIGPSGSGKTSLLAVLESAATLADANARGRYHVFSQSDNMERLFQAGAAIGTLGRLETAPSDHVRCYEFVLRTTSSAQPRPNESIRPPRPRSATHDYIFTMVDGPGEAFFGERALEGELDANKEFRDQLIRIGRKSLGLIICLDAFAEESARQFFSFLLSVFRSLATNHVVPFDRVALVLTKCDRVFAEHGRNAEERTIAADPWERAHEILGDLGMGNLLKYLRPEAQLKLYCGWASVYGFVDGSANFNDEQHVLLNFRQDDGHFFQKWKPFRVLDPFVYVATGEPLSMKPIPAKWLR